VQLQFSEPIGITAVVRATSATHKYRPHMNSLLLASCQPGDSHFCFLCLCGLFLRHLTYVNRPKHTNCLLSIPFTHLFVLSRLFRCFIYSFASSSLLSPWAPSVLSTYGAAELYPAGFINPSRICWMFYVSSWSSLSEALISSWHYLKTQSLPYRKQTPSLL
jgi:hypothetical protein